MTTFKHFSLPARRVGFLTRFALLLATLLGAFVRLAFVTSSRFPLNDGGMFYIMVQDLLRAHYRLPLTTSYNSLGIPFAYPPLPFYLAALLVDVAGVPLLQVLRFLPVVFSILTIPVFYQLCHTILRSRVLAVYAVFAFALIPRSFIWLIMGGGLTRAPGLLFAVLMLRQVYLMYTSHDRRYILPSVLWASLTILSHPAGAWFAAFSAALLLLFLGRSRDGLLNSLCVVGGVLVLTAPWWGTIVIRFGPSPLLAAAGTGGYAWFSWVSLITFDFGEESFLGLLAALSLLGCVICLVERRYLLAAWLALILVADPRSGGTYATVPLAMLSAIGLDRAVLPIASRVAREDPLAMSLPTQEGDLLEAECASLGQLRTTLPKLILAYVLVHAMASALGAGVSQQSVLNVLPAEDQQAMRWVAANTDPASHFLLVTGASSWASDYTAEWFPALAQRVSVATVQGYEWLPRDQFRLQVERSRLLQACASQNLACLESWTDQTEANYRYVYVHELEVRIGPGQSQSCSPTVLEALLISSHYRVVYQTSRVTIFERVDG